MLFYRWQWRESVSAPCCKYRTAWCFKQTCHVYTVCDLCVQVWWYFYYNYIWAAITSRQWFSNCGGQTTRGQSLSTAKSTVCVDSKLKSWSTSCSFTSLYSVASVLLTARQYDTIRITTQGHRYDISENILTVCTSWLYLLMTEEGATELWVERKLDKKKTKKQSAWPGVASRGQQISSSICTRVKKKITLIKCHHQIHPGCLWFKPRPRPSTPPPRPHCQSLVGPPHPESEH